MRTAAWLLVIVAIGAIARAEPATGTVVVSCNETDASLIVDGVLLPERTPAVLTLPAGTHTIEARKPPLVAQKKVVDVADQQTTKVRFELVPAAPVATGSAGSAGSGSAMPPAEGSAATGSGSAPPAGSGSAAGSAATPPAMGSAAGSAATPPPAMGSAAGSAAPPQASAPALKASRCTEGGREVACIQGPHCTEGGRPVPCKKGEPLPVPPAPPTTAAGAGTTAGAGAGAGAHVGTAGAGTGSGAHAEPPHAAQGAAGVEIATTVPHGIAYVDGAPVREAPCVLDLEPGEHVVAVYASGMVPAEVVVKVAAGQRSRVELTPSKPRRRIDVPAQ